MIKDKLKNYGLWLSTFSFIAIVCQNFNRITIPDNYYELVNTFLGILVLLGLINNPTEGKWYSDKNVNFPKEIDFTKLRNYEEDL